jgi:hypothetical protein
MQHVAPVVRGGQQLLREAYLSRDAFCSEEDAARPWCAGTAVKVSRDAWGDLNQLGALLPEAERSYYLDGAPEENGFFRGVTTRSNEFMDRHSEAHAGIPRCSPRTPAVRVGEVIFDMYEICSHLSGGTVRAEQEFQLSRV